MSGDIAITKDGAIQIIRLARPEKKNALTGEMYKTLSDAITSGDDDPSVAVHVLFGQPGAFSAGNDLGDFLANAKGQSGFGGEVLRFIQLLPAIRKPVIAGVDGLAVGIGTTLLFHCDLVYATPISRFSTPFLDLGLVPEAGSSLLMPQRMGYARAFEMLVLGNPFNAEQAVAAGFVNSVVAPADLEAETLKAAMRLAAKPPEALAIARQMMRGNVDEIVQRTNEEALAFSKRLASPEAREAFEAFFEKRPPKFVNRA